VQDVVEEDCGNDRREGRQMKEDPGETTTLSTILRAISL
jgi:hypothetical protein